MKNKNFKDLLTSIGQARKIHAGKMKPRRISRFNPITVTNMRKIAEANPEIVMKALHG